MCWQARKLSPFGSVKVLKKRLIEAGPEIEAQEIDNEVVTSGTVTIEETPAPAKRASRAAKSSVKKTPASELAFPTVTSGRPSRRKPIVIPEVCLPATVPCGSGGGGGGGGGGDP